MYLNAEIYEFLRLWISFIDHAGKLQKRLQVKMELRLKISVISSDQAEKLNEAYIWSFKRYFGQALCSFSLHFAQKKINGLTKWNETLQENDGLESLINYLMMFDLI